MKILFILLMSLASISVLAKEGVQPPECLGKEGQSEIDMSCIEDQLKTTGLGGWVHASVKDQRMLVFTWRRPGNFFVNVQLPMTSFNPKVLQELSQLRRHDQIMIKGDFIQNDAPINHINVTELNVVKAYSGPAEDFSYDPELPKEVFSKTSLIGKIHIVANGGGVVVIEVGDRVMPVFNPNPDLAKGLFRNDKIQLKYHVQTFPFRPAHLVLDVKATEPIKVIERIEDGHGKEITLTGALVMFPKSPQIKFNVFALRQEDSDRVSRNFTIVNFSDFDLFFALRDKLQQVWDDSVSSSEYDRNKYINRKVIVTVKGLKNVVSPDQANPQIVPSQLTDLSVQIL